MALNAGNLRMLGIACVVVAAMLWGSTGTLQSLLPEAREPLAVGALRMLFGALFLTALASTSDACRQVTTRLPWRLIIFAGASIGCYNLLFFWGITKAGVGIGTALAIGSAPIWVMIYEILVMKKVPRPIRASGQFMAICGVGLLVSTGASSDGFVGGAVLSLAAGLSYAAYSLATSQIGNRAPAVLIAASTFCIAALITCPVLFLVPLTWLSGPFEWGVIITLGIGMTGIAYVLYTWGLGQLAASTAVTLALTEPVTAWLLAMIVIGEAVTVYNTIGVAFIMIGLISVSVFPSKKIE